MDDTTDARLQGTAAQCVTAYATWQKSKKDAGAREQLMEALHELRKVASRVEIEVAVSERDEMTMRPLPIPPHRAAQARPVMTDDNGDSGPVRESGAMRRPIRSNKSDQT